MFKVEKMLSNVLYRVSVRLVSDFILSLIVCVSGTGKHLN